ncbi:MAG: glycosyltransferase family 4 protein [Bacteroidaceae bacterium]|nr:glycosyltransferase family 4 protein [Bacteroidaceae bacterium]
MKSQSLKSTIFYIDPQSYHNLSTYDYSLLSNVRDFDVHYLCSKYYDNKRHDWVNFHPVFSYNRIGNNWLKALCYILNYVCVLMLIVRYRPALIHLQWMRLPRYDYYFYKFVKSVFGIKLVYTAHNVLPLHSGERDRARYGLLYHLANQIIVHTEDTKMQLMKLFGLEPGKLSVIQHGRLQLEYDDRLYKSMKAGFDRRYHLDGKIVFTSLGEQSKYKGTDIIANVWAETPELNENEKCLLIMVGRQRGIDVSKLKQFGNVIIDDRKIPNEEYYYLMTHASVYLLTYRKTSFSQSGALMTAITERIPILVSNVGGLADPLKIADIGWMINDVCDKEELRDMLLHILNSQEKIKSIKADNAGWSRIHDFYDWERISLQTQQLYHEIISHQTSP